MQSPVATHIDEIMALCRQFHVQKLELFGSAAKDSLHPLSDIDFLVEFAPLAEGARADAYFGLLEALETLLQRPVDLVMVRAIRNKYFLQAIADSRTLLYAA
jgi:uncharacterized protein